MTHIAPTTAQESQDTDAPNDNMALKENIAIPSMPNASTVFLGGLFFMALLVCLKVAGEIILPIVLAFILKMVLEPCMRGLERIHIRRTLAALVVMVVVISALVGIIALLSGPASEWAGKLPSGFPDLRQRLDFVRKPIESIHGALQHAETLTTTVVTTPDAKPVTVAVQGSSMSDRLLSDTRSFFSGTFETILVLFFLLAAGDTFLRRLVEILPRFQDKRQAVDISQQTELDISAYLGTITFMNAAIGIATAVMMKLCGVEDALLWGTVAFLLNYIPIIGPIICICLFLVVGLLTKDALGAALLPGGLYTVIHLTESMYVTPLLVARRFILNPVIVMVSLIFWYWMWGVPGAIISTPLLAITKIICDRIQSLKALGHFLEGERKFINII